MSPFWKRFTSISILVVFIFWAVWFIRDRWDYFEQILQLRWQILILLIPLIVVGHFLNGILLKLLVSVFNVRLGVVESGSISIISSLINYITPLSGGVGFRAIYLKSRHSFSFGRFTAVFAGSHILGFFVMTVIALATLGYLYWISGSIPTYLAFFFVSLFVALAYVVFFSPVLSQPSKRFWVKVASILNSWDKIRTNRRLVFNFAIVTTLQLLLIGVILYLSFLASRISISYPQVMLIAFMGRIGVLLGITPGSIGIVEGIFLAISPIVGIGREEMLIAAFIRRSTGILVLLTFVPIAWIWLNKTRA